jgi:hypothetical protein
MLNSLFSVIDDNGTKLCDLMEHLDLTYGPVTHHGDEFIAVLGATDDKLELLWNTSQLLDCQNTSEVDGTFSASAIEALYEVREALPEESQELLDAYAATL